MSKKIVLVSKFLSSRSDLLEKSSVVLRNISRSTFEKKEEVEMIFLPASKESSGHLVGIVKSSESLAGSQIQLEIVSIHEEVLSHQ